MPMLDFGEADWALFEVGLGNYGVRSGGGVRLLYWEFDWWVFWGGKGGLLE